ncbi:MAG TPA: hypothetical protein VGE15_05305 [Sphingobacteriaceae bacterium]
MRSRLQSFWFVLALLACSLSGMAQLPPADPAPCNAHPKFRFTVSGSPSMVLNSLTDFLNPQSVTFSIDVESNNNSYKVYVAGVVTGLTGVETTPIPLTSFTVSATNPGGSQSQPVTLGESYKMVVAAGKVKNRVHQITLTRAALPDFTQAPGTHTVLLHIRICQD